MAKILVKDLPSKKVLKAFFNTYAIHHNIKVLNSSYSKSCISIECKMCEDREVFVPSFYMSIGVIVFHSKKLIIHIEPEYWSHFVFCVNDYLKTLKF